MRKKDAPRGPGPSVSSLRLGPPSDRPTLWTRSLGEPAVLPGERVRTDREGTWRLMEPSRTKLAAALANGLGTLPLKQGTDVLYLGAATGSTASHVADIVGPSGTVYAVEKSTRAFARLILASRRWPNIVPILKDARSPGGYSGLVPMVGAMYQDIPQVDQGEIAVKNATTFLKDDGALLLCVKLSSMGRERSARELVNETVRSVGRVFKVDETISLEPYYRRHAFISGRLDESRTDAEAP